MDMRAAAPCENHSGDIITYNCIPRPRPAFHRVRLIKNTYRIIGTKDYARDAYSSRITPNNTPTNEDLFQPCLSSCTTNYARVSIISDLLTTINFRGCSRCFAKNSNVQLTTSDTASPRGYGIDCDKEASRIYR